MPVIRSPQANAKLGEAAMRKEYSRLRSIARKRLERMSRSEFTDTAAYQLNKSHYPQLAKIHGSQELSERLSDLQRFLSAEGSSVTGQRRIQQRRVEALQSHGFDFVNKSNLREFGEFMEMLRSLYPGKPSDVVNLESDYGAYRVLRNAAYTPEQTKRLFERYLEKTRPDSLYLMEGVRPIPNEYRYQIDRIANH